MHTVRLGAAIAPDISPAPMFAPLFLDMRHRKLCRIV